MNALSSRKPVLLAFKLILLMVPANLVFNLKFQTMLQTNALLSVHYLKFPIHLRLLALILQMEILLLVVVDLLALEAPVCK
jgi:hypothetical protein